MAAAAAAVTTAQASATAPIRAASARGGVAVAVVAGGQSAAIEGESVFQGSYVHFLCSRKEGGLGATGAKAEPGGGGRGGLSVHVWACWVLLAHCCPPAVHPPSHPEPAFPLPSATPQA